LGGGRSRWDYTDYSRGFVAIFAGRAKNALCEPKKEKQVKRWDQIQVLGIE
jgi:hypothetical protein